MVHCRDRVVGRAPMFLGLVTRLLLSQTRVSRSRRGQHWRPALAACVSCSVASAWPCACAAKALLAWPISCSIFARWRSSAVAVMLLTTSWCRSSATCATCSAAWCTSWCMFTLTGPSTHPPLMIMFWIRIFDVPCPKRPTLAGDPSSFCCRGAACGSS